MKGDNSMKILLCCKAGVTSNMFASALKDEAKKKDLEIIIWAAAETAIEYSIAQADIVLVTPQLRSSLPKFEDLASPGVPVILIDDEDFQTFNAKKVLEEALQS
jgi:PTS system cellobiose-specific IIB component